MDFLKSKAGILLILLSVIAAAAIIWYCLIGYADRSEPDGTFVQREQQKIVSLDRNPIVWEVEG